MNHKLLKFLLENDALDKFIINRANRSKSWKENNSDPEDIVNQSFEWEETPEGHVFWADIDSRYKYSLQI